MIANAQVYIIADYYQVSKLKDLATTKFRKASKGFELLGFAEVVNLVYDSEGLDSAQELRSAISANIINNATILTSNESFMQECELRPTLARELLPKLVAEYENKLKKEKKRSAEAMAKIREDVNNAKCCRHCGKESNVYFQDDYGISGMSEEAHSLRCVCRTRY